jgi:hypothetical protein
MITPVVSRPITVALVDDHAIVREGLAALLGRSAKIKVVGSAASGRQAVDLVAEVGKGAALPLRCLDRHRARRAVCLAWSGRQARRIALFDDLIHHPQQLLPRCHDIG